MLSKKMQAALNDQINAELASAYIYLAMAAWFEAENLPGSASWMRRQAGEEVAHAMKIFDYVTDQDGRVVLAAVETPPKDYKDMADVWQKALAHEQKVTGLIHALADLAAKEKDHATGALLQWFATEQVEEEKTARGILEQARMIKHSTALYFLDRHLGKEAQKKEQK